MRAGGWRAGGAHGLCRQQLLAGADASVVTDVVAMATAQHGNLERGGRDINSG